MLLPRRLAAACRHSPTQPRLQHCQVRQPCQLAMPIMQKHQQPLPPINCRPAQVPRSLQLFPPALAMRPLRSRRLAAQRGYPRCRLRVYRRPQAEANSLHQRFQREEPVRRRAPIRDRRRSPHIAPVRRVDQPPTISAVAIQARRQRAHRQRAQAARCRCCDRAQLLPNDVACIEDRAFDASAFVVPIIRAADFGDAGKADADAASHRSL